MIYEVSRRLSLFLDSAKTYSEKKNGMLPSSTGIEGTVECVALSGAVETATSLAAYHSFNWPNLSTSFGSNLTLFSRNTFFELVESLECC